MEIKSLLNIARKNFDRIILIAMVLVLMVLSIRYLGVRKESSAVFTEKDLYSLAGIPFRAKPESESEKTFSEMVEKKSNFIFGIRPPAFYTRLIERNPFLNLRDLVVRLFSLKPANLRIGLGENVTFQAQNGIGPYVWECEPKDLGAFEGEVFEARTIGVGKITVTDARGYRASSERIEVVATATPTLRAPEVEVGFIYRGLMKIITPEGENILAIIEESATGKTYFKKSGEEINIFTVKSFNAEKLILFDRNKGKEIEVRRE